MTCPSWWYKQDFIPGSLAPIRMYGYTPCVLRLVTLINGPTRDRWNHTAARVTPLSGNCYYHHPAAVWRWLLRIKSQLLTKAWGRPACTSLLISHNFWGSSLVPPAHQAQSCLRTFAPAAPSVWNSLCPDLSLAGPSHPSGLSSNATSLGRPLRPRT